jgi:HK97 family phage portal protein
MATLENKSKFDMVKNWFKRPIKNTYVPNYPNLPVMANLAQQQYNYKTLTIYDYIRFYNDVAPLSHCIDLIATKFGEIEIKLYDTKKKEFIQSHPALDLFYKPMIPTQPDYMTLAMQELSFLEITGSCFWLLELSASGKPLGITVVNPLFITFIVGEHAITSFTYTQPHKKILTFKLKIINNKYRYLSEDNKQELFYAKLFNPNYDAEECLGQPKLRNLAYQLQQYINLCMLNISQLENGGRPSGCVSTKDQHNYSVEQLRELQQEVNQTVRGSNNAGRILVLDNLEWKSFSFSNKDCEYNAARQQIKEEIYNRFNVPLALVNSNALSLANLEVSALQFYTMSVLPTTQKLYSALSNNILYRYANSENLIYMYDEATITALRMKLLEELKEMAAFGVMSDNEIRLRMNLNNAADANNVYKPSTMVPTYSVEN